MFETPPSAIHGTLNWLAQIHTRCRRGASVAYHKPITSWVIQIEPVPHTNSQTVRTGRQSSKLASLFPGDNVTSDDSQDLGKLLYRLSMFNSKIEFPWG
nr:AKR_HP1_G0022360.mRNA.1.CDS.1 [Saccharomyces cerevisiae]